MNPTETEIEGIPAEYILAKQMVVFSHGFGVGRDDRGLFSEIADELPDDVGYVMFDYNQEKGDETLVASLSEQAKKLKTVIDWVKQQPNVLDISIVGHSMGCLSAALAAPKNPHRIIMLAPPLAISKRIREYFTSKPGVEHQDGLWHIPRRDGSTSVMADGLFEEFASLDAQKLLKDYAAKQPLVVIAAGSDEVLKGIDYSVLTDKPGITCLEIAGASHNFEGSARDELQDKINEILLEGRQKVSGGYGGGGYNL